jgi:membrane-bound lytic murein transglycosylase A
MATDMLSSLLPPMPDGTGLREVAFKDLIGWEDQDFKKIFATFLVSCRALINDETPVRLAQSPNLALYNVCKHALMGVPANASAEIKIFFETYFTAFHIVPESGSGFLTAYYEPEIEGSRTQTSEFYVPVLGKPKWLNDKQLTPESIPDRAQIDDGALASEGLELVWFRDHVELFMMHVQGSGRVRYTDGTYQRFTYAGRNGYPYTSIGKQIVAERYMSLDTMTLASLKAWLRANPIEAKRIMRLNRSYIFFAKADIPAHLGPIGGSGVSLTPHYSIAIDRNIWPYGLPFFVDTHLPRQDGALEPVAHLMIGQDTGSAILGPARADYFMGSGDEAGVLAGGVRHAMNFTVLWPKKAAS